MARVFSVLLVISTVFVAATTIRAQTAATDTIEATDLDIPAPAQESPAWSFSALAYGYVVPDEDFFVMPLFYADRQRLHLEMRYNYEAHETASLWAGYRFTKEGRWSLDVVPMLGGVVGEVDGLAPGVELTLGRHRVELYTESEYLLDFEDESNNFFYTWSELYYLPTESLRLGLVGQRTRSFQTEVEVNRGFFAGAVLEQFDFTVYMLNLGWDEPTWIFAAAVYF